MFLHRPALTEPTMYVTRRLEADHLFRSLALIRANCDVILRVIDFVGGPLPADPAAVVSALEDLFCRTRGLLELSFFRYDILAGANSCHPNRAADSTVAQLQAGPFVGRSNVYRGVARRNLALVGAAAAQQRDRGRDVGFPLSAAD
jgi:hypothetical protein